MVIESSTKAYTSARRRWSNKKESSQFVVNVISLLHELLEITVPLKPN